MFDPELFRTVLATGPKNTNNAIEEADEVMERVFDACDATMPRKSTCNRHPPVYWWNNSILLFEKNALRQEGQNLVPDRKRETIKN